jgi:hypothetical protein
LFGRRLTPDPVATVDAFRRNSALVAAPRLAAVTAARRENYRQKSDP